jgi:hypothetical protein
MDLLATWAIRHGEVEKRIEMFHGDLSQLPLQHAVDILVVSAFPNDYIPTPTSLIGALYRAGISVGWLARSKERDMRSEFSCWLSQPVGVASFRQLLCIESGWRGTPPEITDDLFRALAPLFLAAFQNGSVAMPIIGAGDQGWPVENMLEAILRTAISWLKRGLPISVIKIVVHSSHTVERAKRKFLEIQSADRSEERSAKQASEEARLQQQGNKQGNTAHIYDVFLSYCHEDLVPAQSIAEQIKRSIPGARIFYDQKTISIGQSWLMEIAESLDGSRKVAALYTPSYWSSRYCIDEFCAALTRQHDTGEQVLFPIYYRTAVIPYYFRNVQYVDCREANPSKFAGACSALCSALS